MPTITVSSPENLIVSDNGIARNQPAESTTKSNKLLEANATLAVWLVFFAIGGGILALYYSRIGYLPDMEWKSALIYLFIGSLVGSVLGLLLTMSVFFPGFIWSAFIVFDPGLDFNYPTPASDLSDKEAPRTLCTLSTIRKLGVPFLAVLLFSHLALPVGKRVYWVFALIAVGFTFGWMRGSFRRLMKVKARKVPQYDAAIAERQLFNYTAWFTLSVLLNQISMYLIYWLSGRPGELSKVFWNNLTWTQWRYGELPAFIGLTLICTSGVWIATHAVAALYRYHQRQAVIAALVAAGLLLFTADHFSSLSMKLMNYFGMGYNQRFNLLVTDEGYNKLRRMGVKECGAPPHVCNAEILSQVGDHYFFRVDDTVYVTLAKTDVVVISPLN